MPCCNDYSLMENDGYNLPIQLPVEADYLRYQFAVKDIRVFESTPVISIQLFPDPEGNVNVRFTAPESGKYRYEIIAVDTANLKHTLVEGSMYIKEAVVQLDEVLP